jgi:hypothetical protein
MSELDTLTNEVRALRLLNEEQSRLLARVDLALTGDAARGIVGVVEGQRALGLRLTTAEADIAELKREKWFARLGQSAVAGILGGVAVWFKAKVLGE